jgi:hypothetical protein
MSSSSPGERYWSTRTLGYVFLGTWLAILAATLWPLNPFPRNEVRWLPDANGLRFSHSGMVTSSGLFPAAATSESRPCSVEVLVRPENDTDVHTFLGFYVAGQHALSFELRQYGQILLIFHAVRGARGRLWTPEIDVEHVFQRGKSTLIAIVSGTRGTTVYLNGELAAWVPGYRLPASSLTGQLILGGAPVVYDAWPGDLSALAFYGEELSAAKVREHFAAWSMDGKLPSGQLQSAMAAYAFDERGGVVVHNIAASTAPDLLIPVHFQVPHKAFLTPPWREITPLWIYIDDVVRNIVGFVPLGVAAYLYLLRRRGRSDAIWLTILLGFATSLSIEVLQWFIPQRVSGMTDIITNTTGAALGVLVLQARPIRVMLAALGIAAMEFRGDGADEYSRGEA